MALNIVDETVDRLVNSYIQETGLSKVESARRAFTAELNRIRGLRDGERTAVDGASGYRDLENRIAELERARKEDAVLMAELRARLSGQPAEAIQAEPIELEVLPEEPVIESVPPLPEFLKIKDLSQDADPLVSTNSHKAILSLIDNVAAQQRYITTEELLSFYPRRHGAKSKDSDRSYLLLRCRHYDTWLHIFQNKSGVLFVIDHQERERGLRSARRVELQWRSIDGYLSYLLDEIKRRKTALYEEFKHWAHPKDQARDLFQVARWVAAALSKVPETHYQQLDAVTRSTAQEIINRNTRLCPRNKQGEYPINFTREQANELLDFIEQRVTALLKPGSHWLVHS